MREPGPAGDWAPCTIEVRALAGDPAAYAAKLATPLLYNNTLPWWLVWEPFAAVLVPLPTDAGVPGKAEGGLAGTAGGAAAETVGVPLLGE